ncbi:ABC transporter permease [Acrocarpospora catenulata]|uniref:ABC transporter permease n=1 Tax=Acrocarpospora catenulata TaxID=2836182 RepID=UPI001BDA40CF|nr:FtsX-like permease family protein [Acrocarpospora catenulata]
MQALWLRLEVRRRWRSLAVLALLVAFASGTVLAAVAGARRGGSAVERLVAVTLPFSAVVLPNQPKFDWDRVRRLPSVAAVTTFPLIPGYVVKDPVGFQPDLPMVVDREAWHTIEKPVILAGRLPSPDRADEAVIVPKFTERYGKGVGDTVTVQLYTAAQVDAALAGSASREMAPEGPEATATIVGVIRSAWFSDSVTSSGDFILSPGFFTKYRDEMVGTKELASFNALVRLTAGFTALPQFKRELAAATGRSDLDVWDAGAIKTHQEEFLAFEAYSLLAFGLAALAASLVLVGQTVARYTAATVAELHQLRMLGLTPRQSVIAAALGPTLAASAGAVLGVAAAYGASAYTPVGAAALIEPTPGLDADWPVLLPGGLAVPVLVALGALLSGALALRGAHARPARRSVAALLAGRANLPVPAVVGTRFALESGRGRGSVPVRPALLGTVTGVLGILAAFTFSSGVADAGERPERFGQTFHLQVYLYDSGAIPPDDAVYRALAGHPDVAGISDDLTAVAQSGRTSVTLHTYDLGAKPLPIVVERGRPPHDDQEIMLALRTAQELGAGIGDEVALTGQPGRGTFRVTGIGFVPKGSHNTYFEGGLVSMAAFDRLFDAYKFHTLLVSLRPGVDPEQVVAALQELVRSVPGAQFSEFAPAPDLIELAEIRDMRILPVALAAFLALLAVGAVGHVLATAVRRRRHELAVMRALGLTRRQARWIVATQASVLAVIGVVAGVPLGMALGRMLWRLVADLWPLAYQPPVAFWALLTIGPAALLVANLLAAWPGHRAARLRVGHVLRAE